MPFNYSVILIFISRYGNFSPDSKSKLYLNFICCKILSQNSSSHSMREIYCISQHWGIFSPINNNSSTCRWSILVWDEDPGFTPSLSPSIGCLLFLPIVNYWSVDGWIGDEWLITLSSLAFTFTSGGFNSSTNNSSTNHILYLLLCSLSFLCTAVVWSAALLCCCWCWSNGFWKWMRLWSLLCVQWLLELMVRDTSYRVRNNH